MIDNTEAEQLSPKQRISKLVGEVGRLSRVQGWQDIASVADVDGLIREDPAVVVRTRLQVAGLTEVSEQHNKDLLLEMDRAIRATVGDTVGDSDVKYIAEELRVSQVTPLVAELRQLIFVQEVGQASTTEDLRRLLDEVSDIARYLKDPNDPKAIAETMVRYKEPLTLVGEWRAKYGLLVGNEMVRCDSIPEWRRLVRRDHPEIGVLIDHFAKGEEIDWENIPGQEYYPDDMSPFTLTKIYEAAVGRRKILDEQVDSEF